MAKNFNLNVNCELEVGPCSCGAFHSEEEILSLTKKRIEFIKRIYYELGFDKPLKYINLPSLEEK